MGFRALALIVIAGATIAGIPSRAVAQFPEDSPSCTQPLSPALKLWCDGGRAFIRGNYAEAIRAYGRAFASERTHRTLTRTAFRVLVDNLGIAYGITGSLDSSQAVLEFGVAQDSSYPLFYYNLACLHAERLDEATTIRYLRMAFDRRANVIAGESMPDPWTDDSFQRFMNSKRFTDSLGGISPRSH